MNNSFSRRFQILSVTLFGAVFAFANLAFASSTASISSPSVGPTPFYHSIPGQSAVLSVTYNLDFDIDPTIPVTEEIRTTTGQTVYNFGSSFPDDRSVGVQSLTWDGMCNTTLKGEFAACVAGQNVSDGDYVLFIQVNLDKSGTPDPTYTSPAFTVAKTVVPTLTLLETPPTTYVPGVSPLFPISYHLTRGNDVDSVVRFKIVGPEGANPKEDTFSEIKSADGDFSFEWDGKFLDDVPVPGDYHWTLISTNSVSGYSVPSATLSGVLNVTNTQNTSTKCAGFTDVSATDSDCDAITYVKSLGAMTGNPNGTFDPDGILQRDQIAKIVLETFGKFNSQSDYCKGNNPFPDVTNSAWSYQYVCRGKALSIITGYLSGSDAGFYRPNRSVNRAEFLALVLRNLTDAMPSVNSTSYTDVASGAWFAGYAKFSKNNDLFTGSKLYPTNEVSRVEVANVIYKLHLAGKI